MKKILSLVEIIIRLICTVLLTVITLGVFTQVVMRYVFNAPVFWLEEFVINQMVWVVFLGVPLAVINRSHTRITFFVNLLPVKARQWLEILTQIVCTTWMLYISWHSLPVVKTTMRSLSTALQMPRGYLYLAIPVCGVIIALYYLVNIADDIKAVLGYGPAVTREEDAA